MRSLKPVLSAALALAAFAASAHADFDYRPYVSDGKIIIGGHDDEAGQDVAELHVGVYGFGETPDDPYNLGDPGFTTNGPSTFVSGSTLNFTGQPVSGSGLLYWNGAGESVFTAAPAGVSLLLQTSPAVTTNFTAAGIAYTPGSGPMFVDRFSSSGGLHRHLTSSIFFNGLQTPDSVPTGAYLLSFTLANPDGAALPSATTFALFNNALSESQIDTAAAAVEGAYVPEPGVLGFGRPSGAGGPAAVASDLQVICRCGVRLLQFHASIE